MHPYTGNLAIKKDKEINFILKISVFLSTVILAVITNIWSKSTNKKSTLFWISFYTIVKKIIISQNLKMLFFNTISQRRKTSFTKT